jgi:transketolase
VLLVADGNDVQAIDAAILNAKQSDRPSLIAVCTQIGYGLPTRQGTEKAHGEPPGADELAGAKRKLGWPLQPDFYVPQPVLAHFRAAGERGAQAQAEWGQLKAGYCSAYPQLGAELERRLAARLPENWQQALLQFPTDPKGLATRASSGKVLNALAERIPELIGGSADLAPSNKTWIAGSPAMQADTPQGRNMHFGVREHGMGAVVNGMALHGGVIPYGGTFLVFSDYMRPAIRVSALSEYPSIWVFTHDSIGLGEDGPTHQPIEQLASLRAIPNLVTLRPGDANEVTQAWKVALARRHAPTALVFSRQNVPTLDREKFAPASGLENGAYVLADLGDGDPDLILMASGSELALIVSAGQQLAQEGFKVRLISFPSWELFAVQDQVYRDAVLPPQVHARLAVEAGSPQGWHRWVGDQGAVIGVDGFGASAPYQVLFERMGFTVENVVAQAHRLLDG